ncbi:hypothetical protein CYLTODRAFT_407185 [Cylindrobasidium torrendii FP15055 ss-10]|uniref:Uncharacterized protein n=1 Tax=Cylindrobasidium torrendii FP15055 ss-10 TaxID=1314674 RepID=A0A0D7BQZ0_9AGAR|nr:hypothetical protein CYLTODRAFT_407185 [Cylindrobasidium torrendii FP15055 ss-10]
MGFARGRGGYWLKIAERSPDEIRGAPKRNRTATWNLVEYWMFLACAARAVSLCAAGGTILSLPTTWQFAGDGGISDCKPQHSGEKALNVQYWLYIVHTTEYLDSSSDFTDDGDETDCRGSQCILDIGPSQQPPCFLQTHGPQTAEQLQEHPDTCPTITRLRKSSSNTFLGSHPRLSRLQIVPTVPLTGRKPARVRHTQHIVRPRHASSETRFGFDSAGFESSALQDLHASIFSTVKEDICGLRRAPRGMMANFQGNGMCGVRGASWLASGRKRWALLEGEGDNGGREWKESLTKSEALLNETAQRHGIWWNAGCFWPMLLALYRSALRGVPFFLCRRPGNLQATAGMEVLPWFQRELTFPLRSVSALNKWACCPVSLSAGKNVPHGFDRALLDGSLPYHNHNHPRPFQSISDCKPQHSGEKALNVRYWLYIVHTTEYLDSSSHFTDDGDETDCRGSQCILDIGPSQQLPCFPQTHGPQTAEQLQEHPDTCPTITRLRKSSSNTFLGSHPRLSRLQIVPTVPLYRIILCSSPISNLLKQHFTMSAVTLFSLPVELLTIIFEHLLGQLPTLSEFYEQRAILLSCSRRIRKIICDRHPFWRYLTVQRAEIEAVVLSSTEGIAPVIPPSLLLTIGHARGLGVNLFIDARASVNTDFDDEENNASDVETGKKLDVVVNEIFAAHKSRLVSLKVDEGTLLGCGVRIMRAIRAHRPQRLESLTVVTGNGSFGEWEEDTTLDPKGHPTPVVAAHSQAPIPALRSLAMHGVMNEHDDEKMSGKIWDVATLAEATFSDMVRTYPTLLFLRALLDKNPGLRRLALHDSFDHTSSGPTREVFAGVQELDIGVSSTHNNALAFMTNVKFPDLKHLTLTGKASDDVFPSPAFITAANTALTLNELDSLHLRDIRSQPGIDLALFDGLKRLRISGTTLQRKGGALPFKSDMNRVYGKMHLPFPTLETLEMEVTTLFRQPGRDNADWETEVKRAFSLISGRARRYLSHEDIPRTLQTARILFRGQSSSSFGAPTARPGKASSRALLPVVKALFLKALKSSKPKMTAAQDIPFSVECVFTDEDGEWMEVVDLKALAFKTGAAGSR